MEAKDKLEQDEAIYQAGKKAGIKEVVEWINERMDKAVLIKYGTVALGFSITTWNAKLKDWGLKEE